MLRKHRIKTSGRFTESHVGTPKVGIDLRDLVVCLPDGLPQLAALTRDACGDRARRVMGLTRRRAREGVPPPPHARRFKTRRPLRLHVDFRRDPKGREQWKGFHRGTKVGFTFHNLALVA